jgi:putative transposase
VIAFAVWAYHRFPLSLRELEELLAARGIEVTYETIRTWSRDFGPVYARGLRCRQPGPGNRWHMDEMVVRMNGVHHILWRAVDQDGMVIDILMQKRRDAAAAKRFFRKLLKGVGTAPRVIVTDKLPSDGAAHRDMSLKAEHRSAKALNNRAENSHQPTRRHERGMHRFRSPGTAQRYLAVHSRIANAFPRRHGHTSAAGYRAARTYAFQQWKGVAGISAS